MNIKSQRAAGGTSVSPSLTKTAVAYGAADTVGRALSVVLAIGIARALDPGEVGVLAVASITVSTLAVIASSVETAGVTGRVKSTDVRHAVMAVAVRGCFVVLLIGGTLVALPTLSALVVGQEGAEVRLMGLVRFLLWQLVFEVLGTFPRVVLQRRLRLGGLAATSLIQSVAHVALALGLLRNGYGAEGVVAAYVIASALGMGLAWLVLISQPHRGERDSSSGRGVLREIIVATLNLATARFAGYFSGRLDNIVVSGVLGPAMMSFYAMAWSLSRQPIGLLSQAVDSVLIPTLARVQSDAERTHRILRGMILNYYLILAPISAGLFVLAPPLVTVVLGRRWLPMIPCLRLMSITILATPVVTGCHCLLVATGKAQLVAVAAVVQLLAVAAIIGPLAKVWGILGAAVGDGAVMVILTALLFTVSRQAMPSVSLNALRAAVVPVSAAIVGAIGAWPVGLYIEHPLLMLGCQATLLAILYVAVLNLLAGPQGVTMLVHIMQDFIGGPTRRARRLFQARIDAVDKT